MLLEPVPWTSRTTCRPHARIADEVLSGRGRWGECFWLFSIDGVWNRYQHVCLVLDMNQLSWSKGKRCLVSYLLLYRGILRWLNCTAQVTWSAAFQYSLVIHIGLSFFCELETGANCHEWTVIVHAVQFSCIQWMTCIYKYEQFSSSALCDLSNKSNWGMNALKWSYETRYLWNHWLMPVRFPFHISQNTKCKQQQSAGVQGVCNHIFIVGMALKGTLNEVQQRVVMVWMSCNENWLQNT